MGLRFDPVGGGQFKQAVQQIIEAERQPIRNLEVRKTREEARMKLFQEFKTKFNGLNSTLSEFTTFKSFRELKADLGDAANIIGVTLDKAKAEPGTYTMQIDQLAARTSVISNGFSDPDEPCVGVGFVIAEMRNGDTAEIFVDEEHASMRGIASLINQDRDLPFHASVVKDFSNPEKPWRMVISSKTEEFEKQVTFPELYFIDGTEDFYIDEQHDAQNALIQLDGFQIEAESNDIKDFLTGINLHLKQARPEQPFTMTITEDFQKVSGKLKTLIDQINGVLEFINKQNAIDEKSDTKTTFAGDTGLQNIEYRLRNILHEGFPVEIPNEEGYRLVFLNEIGVEFDKTGLLKFKEDKFQKTLENDFNGIADALTGPNGLANQLRAMVDGYTRLGSGMISMREQSLRNRIQKLDNDIMDKERRIEQRAQNLTQQFARLQSSLSNMQRQSQYLASALPGAGSGNMVSQLLG